MNRMIVFQEYIVSEKKEVSLAAYYPANYSILEMDTARINPKNVKSAIVVNDYYSTDKQEVCETSMKDTIKGLNSIIKALTSYELMIYSHTYKKTQIATMYIDYQHIYCDTSEDIPQLKLISDIVMKELKERMKHY